MDSNHDIVPTLRMMDGVYTRLAADEIERLRARVAVLERRADTSLIPGAAPTHRCKVCGAWWRKWNVDGESSWNLCSPSCGECCDNAAMADQIEALASPAKVGVQPAHEQNARFAIDGAISLGMQGVKQPDADHWLAKYWDIGRQLAAKVGGDGLIEQHARDSAELRRLCAARDEARRTAEYWKANHLAGNAEIERLKKLLEAKVGGDAREAFEVWVAKEWPGLVIDRVPLMGFYKGDDGARLEDMWAAWQAALSADGGEDKRDAERYRLIRSAPTTVMRYGGYLSGQALDAQCDAIAANQAKGEAK